jgi:hypothetical protein
MMGSMWQSTTVRIMAAGNKKGEKKGLGQGHSLNDLLAPIRPHLLKFPPSPNSLLSYESICGLIYS